MLDLTRTLTYTAPPSGPTDVGERPGAVGRRTSPTLGTREPDLRDPANGEPVRRCHTCSAVKELIDFRLWSVKHNRWAGYYRLCSACWSRRNDAPDPDPLQATG